MRTPTLRKHRHSEHSEHTAEQWKWNLAIAGSAPSSQVPFNEERLTKPNKWEGRSVTTPAAGTGLWLNLRKLWERQKDFRSSQLSSWTRNVFLKTEADPLLLYHCCAFGWWSGGGRLRGLKLLRSSLRREMCPRGGSLLRPREENPLNINVPSKLPGKKTFPRLFRKWVPVLSVVVKTRQGNTPFCVGAGLRAEERWLVEHTWSLYLNFNKRFVWRFLIELVVITVFTSKFLICNCCFWATESRRSSYHSFCHNLASGSRNCCSPSSPAVFAAPPRPGQRSPAAHTQDNVQ